MASTSQSLGIAVLAASVGPAFLLNILPAPMAIGEFIKTDQGRAQFRHSEMVGSALALSVGIGASAMAHDPLPFVGTVIVLGFLLWDYESAYRGMSRVQE